MTIRHHPGPEYLMSCAAGSMPEALAAVMASHLEMCPQCRAELKFLDRIGGALLEDISPENLNGPVPEAVHHGAALNSDGRFALVSDVPQPLQRFVGTSLKEVEWRRVAPGVWQHRLPLSKNSKASLRLIKTSPGRALPYHGHSGLEMTLILQGAFKDQHGFYAVGDLVEMDENVDHAPVAMEGLECICLFASEGKMQFQSVLAKLVQRFTGF